LKKARANDKKTTQEAKGTTRRLVPRAGWDLPPRPHMKILEVLDVLYDTVKAE